MSGTNGVARLRHVWRWVARVLILSLLIGALAQARLLGAQQAAFTENWTGSSPYFQLLPNGGSTITSGVADAAAGDGRIAQLTLPAYPGSSPNGGPGIPGASWGGVSFVNDPANVSNRLLQLAASTNGTAAGTTQSELYHQQKFYEGTYAARVFFSPGALFHVTGEGPGHGCRATLLYLCRRTPPGFTAPPRSPPDRSRHRRSA